MSNPDPVFLDSSGLVALLNADDWLHDEATREFESIGRINQSMITTDWVLAELGNSLARTPARALVAEFTRDILVEPRAEVVFVDATLLRQGLNRYAMYSDKTWGLVDCVSFAVMDQSGCRAALSHDRHFEQAGFRRLLTKQA